MTEEKIHEAMGQMLTHCQILEATDYHSVSARGVLNTLGYDREEQDAVIQALYDGGFNYCLDPMFPSKTRGVDEPTPDFACFWGPDQLRSRVECVAPWPVREAARPR
jgi:hypothetical protein